MYFFLKLQAKYLIPARTVSMIAGEFSNMIFLSNKQTQDKIELSADIENKSLVMDILKDNVSQEILKLMSTDHQRKKYFSDNLNFVAPHEIKISNNRQAKNEVFHYVPLKESLKALLSKPSIKHQIANPDRNFTDSVVSDLKCGKLYKQIMDNNTIGIILYSDEFEIVNPIGASKSKHKLLGFYYILTNTYPWNRSHT